MEGKLGFGELLRRWGCAYVVDGVVEWGASWVQVEVDRFSYVTRSDVWMH